MRNSYAIDKICVVELPHPLLKSRGSAMRNNFLEYRTNKATPFTRRNEFYALLAINKAKHILNRLLRYSKSKKKNRKSPIFERLPFLY